MCYLAVTNGASMADKALTKGASTADEAVVGRLYVARRQVIAKRLYLARRHVVAGWLYVWPNGIACGRATLHGGADVYDQAMHHVLAATIQVVRRL